MAIFRVLSLLLIMIALMLLGADVVSSLEAPKAMVLRPLDKILMLLGADLKPWLQANLPSNVAGVALSILSIPGWIIFGILGVIMALLVPPKRQKPAGRAAPPIEHH